MDIRRILRKVYGHYLGEKWGISRVVRQDLAEQFLKDYHEKRLPVHKIAGIHGKGFSVESWLFYELDAEKSTGYLSDAAYSSLYPLNASFSSWIDDKLTLKYLCYGTPLDQYMPAYYYQLDENGEILCLPDCPNKQQKATVADIAQLLRSKGTLALKLICSTYGVGFYKAEYHDGIYALNGNEMDKTAFLDKLKSLKNYLITEYFYPHPALHPFCRKTPGSIRYIAGSIAGEPEMLISGMAMGTKESGFVDNAAGHIWCKLDAEGYFSSGEVVDPETLKGTTVLLHPDTQAKLEGRVPHWEEIKQAVKTFCAHFPQLKYMGFDFVVTSDDRVIILEINSLSALDCFQNSTNSVFDMPAGAFFQNKLKKNSR